MDNEHDGCDEYDECHEYEKYKSVGYASYDKIRNKGKYNECGREGGRSRNYKHDKARNFRKKLDKRSHHRQRQVVKSAISHEKMDGIECMPPSFSAGNRSSYTCNGEKYGKANHGRSQGLSSKKMIGVRFE